MDKYFDFFNKYSDYYMEIAKDQFQKLHIHRKIEHSKRVYKIAVEVARKLELNEEEIRLVGIASLFHDIGRLPQFFQYNTYKDSKICDHSLLGIQVLEQEKILDDLSSDEKRMILEIIRLHDYDKVPSDLPKKLYDYVSIVRDADKIDWMYSMVNIIPKLSEKDQAVFYSNKENKNFISKKVVESILNNQVISKKDMDTIDELRAAAMGWVTSFIKCPPSYEIIKRENLIQKTFNLMGDTKEKQVIFDYVSDYMNRVR